jgi:hypothetical protein
MLIGTIAAAAAYGIGKALGEWSLLIIVDETVLIIK